MKAHDYFSWCLIGFGGYFTAFLIFLLAPIRALNAPTLSAFFPLLVFLFLHAITSTIGSFVYPPKTRVYLFLLSPVLLVAEIFGFATTLFRYSLLWSGIRYRFNRKGQVTAISHPNE